MKKRTLFVTVIVLAVLLAITLATTVMALPAGVTVRGIDRTVPPGGGARYTSG